MLESKTKLEERLQMKFQQITPDKIKETAKNLYTNHNIPLSVSMSMLQNQRNIGQYDEFVLYCVTEEIAPGLVSSYFTESEISKYKEYKLKSDNGKESISFNVLQVAEDQWIGCYSVQELMKLRKRGLINYNANTQRTLEHKIIGGKEAYVVSLNRNAVAQIKESISKKVFIPNTITLNINEGEDNSFVYDKGSQRLIVKKIESFDIVDGYHRYIAFGQAYDEDPEFDYPLEIRITNFSESKGKQFTYQEDQKTHMKKIDSDGMNQYNNYNIVVERINQDNMCDFFDEIKNGGKILPGHLSVALTLYNINTRKDIIDLSKVIREKLNELTACDPSLLDKYWAEHDVYTAIYGFYRNIPPEIIVRTINYIDKNIDVEMKRNIKKYKTFSSKIKQYIEDCEGMVM